MTDQPFGPGCSAVPKSGSGSFDGMAKDPVATAASNNPALSTLVTAVKKAGLVDTLNNAKDITVFAPTNDAFGKIPKTDLDKVLADKAMLTKVLTNHVVAEPITPKQLENGSYDHDGEDQADLVRLGHVLHRERLLEGRLRQRADGQRDGVHRRHRPDAQVTCR